MHKTVKPETECPFCYLVTELKHFKDKFTFENFASGIQMYQLSEEQISIK